MSRKFYDLSAKGGEYTNSRGEKKHRFQPLGKLAVEDDGRMWGVLEILGMEVQFSVFEQKPRDQPAETKSSAGGSGRSDLDDDIPF